MSYEILSTDPDTAHAWLVSEYDAEARLVPVAVESRTDADLEALAEAQGPKATVMYRRENPWQAQRRTLARVDLYEHGVVYECLDVRPEGAR